MASPYEPSEKPRTSPPADSKAYEGGRIEIDRVKEKKLVRKLDLHIVPVVMLLYLLSFLDRLSHSNIYQPISI